VLNYCGFVSSKEDVQFYNVGRGWVQNNPEIFRHSRVSGQYCELCINHILNSYADRQIGRWFNCIASCASITSQIHRQIGRWFNWHLLQVSLLDFKN
jgi:hypothetical protein